MKTGDAFSAPLNERALAILADALGAAGWSVEPTASRVVVMSLSDVTDVGARPAQAEVRPPGGRALWRGCRGSQLQGRRSRFASGFGLHPRGPVEAAAEIQVPREGKPGRGRLPDR